MIEANKSSTSLQLLFYFSGTEVFRTETKNKLKTPKNFVLDIIKEQKEQNII